MALAALEPRPETKTESMERLALSFDQALGTCVLLGGDIFGERTLFAYVASIPCSGM